MAHAYRRGLRSTALLKERPLGSCPVPRRATHQPEDHRICCGVAWPRCTMGWPVDAGSVRTAGLAGGSAVGRARRQLARGSARRFEQDRAAELRMSRLRDDPSCCGRRARAGCDPRPCEGCVGAGRSRSRSTRIGNRERDGDRLGQRVRNILESEDPEPDDALKARRLRRLTALRAGSQVGPGGGSEAQPAVRAAEVGHERDPAGFLPGRPRPHPGQAPFITGSTDRSSSRSKYTRWRPTPDTRRTCPHSAQR